MKLKIERSVVVITPSVGNDKLLQAIDSVENQTYKNIKHLVVSDGPEYLEKIVSMKLTSTINYQVTETAENTGGGGFYGHRIYAAYPHLVNEDYIAFLDEDNWYDPEHISSLVDTIEHNNYDWAHSLRKVYVGDDFLDNDCCEAIGRWPIYFSQDNNPQHLVDTSSFMFRRDFLIKVCNHWHSGWGGDRRFFHIITKMMNLNNYGTNGLHTLNYRLPDMQKAYGGDFDFFKKGNKVIEQKYGGYPWLKT